MKGGSAARCGMAEVESSAGLGQGMRTREREDEDKASRMGGSRIKLFADSLRAPRPSFST